MLNHIPVTRSVFMTKGNTAANAEPVTFSASSTTPATVSKQALVLSFYLHYSIIFNKHLWRPQSSASFKTDVSVLTGYSIPPDTN